MAKVYLPLASAEAHGAFGELVVYQGVTCRAYVVPTDPRTDEQVTVRELFHDVTKMEKYCGTWVKGAWKTVFGSRWYTQIYKRVTENGAARYAQHGAVWDGFTEGEKEEWNEAAPFKVTFHAPGEVFYVVMAVTREWMIELGAPLYEMPALVSSAAAAVGAWAVQDLSGAFGSGDFEDSNLLITYSGTWIEQTNASASGGKYHESAASGVCVASFYFYGTQLTLEYQKDIGRGIAQVGMFGMLAQGIDQNAGAQSWGNVWVSPGLIKGLHYVTVSRTGSGGIDLDALDVTAKTIKTPAQTAIADNFVIPGVGLGRTVAQTIPAYSGGGPSYLVEWDLEYFDTVGMHDVIVEPGRVYCKVPGYYGARCFVKWANTASEITTRLEIRKNGVVVALSEFYRTSGGSKPVYNEVTRFLEMGEGDYLEVWAYQSLMSSLNLVQVVDLAPNFEVQMFQRTAIKIDTVNITITG